MRRERERAPTWNVTHVKSSKQNNNNKNNRWSKIEYERRETPRRKIINWQIKEGLNCLVTKVGGRCFERTKDWPEAGQWAQTGFKDSDSAIPHTADSNWIRISRNSTKGSKSDPVLVYHWLSGPSQDAVPVSCLGVPEELRNDRVSLLSIVNSLTLTY